MDIKNKIRLLLLAFIFSTLFGGLTHIAHAEELKGSISATPASYNFGDIYPEKGKVSTTFEIKNSGKESLKINRISTSCGCTTAEIDQSDLKPGEIRKMLVTFDPNTHPDEKGTITRMVYIQTSDPVTPELEIELTGNIIRKSENENKVIVFFNEACEDCGELVMDYYPKFFAEYGYEVIKKDYINERDNRKILNEYNEKWKVPFELQSHIEAFVEDKLLIGGHVPEDVIIYLLENKDKYERLLVFQDEMHGSAKDYKVWDFKGEIKTYLLDEPITTYLDEMEKMEGGHGTVPNLSSPKTFWSFFTLISVSAFLDGINPCAIAVLLFFIAFLFSIKRSRKSIWKMGLVYIFAVYLAYFLIGIGIAQAIVISGAPHLMAYIGSYLVIALGVIQLLGIVFPRFPIKLHIPINTKAVIEKWVYKSTLPAAFVGGFIVGLCTFPCSGGIYVAIIGMLAASQTYMQGIGWMLWYNLVFVAPLLIIMALAGNPLTTSKLQVWERKESTTGKLIIGLTMIALGVIMLLFFV